MFYIIFRSMYIINSYKGNKENFFEKINKEYMESI